MNHFTFPILSLLMIGSPLRLALAVDLVPLDVIPPPPNLTAVMLGYTTSQRGNLYREGERQNLDSRLQIDQIALRIGHSFEWDGRPSYFYAQTARVDTQPGGQLSAIEGHSGLGDLAMMVATWPYVDRTAGRYVGVAAYLMLPTGEYDAERTIGLNTNPGENRVRGALQMGYSHRLTDHSDWMVASDVALFGDNDDYIGSNPVAGRLEQRPLFSAQTALSYRFNQALSLSLSYLYHEGGAIRTEFSDWSNGLRVHRYLVTGLLGLPFVGRVTLEYGGDLQTENGFFEDHRFMIRIAKFF